MAAWLLNLFDRLFGCSHGRTTFPITAGSSSTNARRGTYVVCLDCGKELSYDWDRMRMVEPGPVHEAAGLHSIPVFITKWASAMSRGKV